MKAAMNILFLNSLKAGFCLLFNPVFTAENCFNSSHKERLIYYHLHMIF